MQNPNKNFENNDLNNFGGQNNIENGGQNLPNNSNELLKRNQQGELSNNLMEQSMEIKTLANEKPGSTRGVVPKRRPSVPITNSSGTMQKPAQDENELDDKTVLLLWQLFYRSSPTQAGGMFNAQELLSLLSNHLTKPQKKAKDFLGNNFNTTKPAITGYGR